MMIELAPAGSDPEFICGVIDNGETTRIEGQLTVEECMHAGQMMRDAHSTLEAIQAGCSKVFGPQAPKDFKNN